MPMHLLEMQQHLVKKQLGQDALMQQPQEQLQQEQGLQLVLELPLASSQSFVSWLECLSYPFWHPYRLT